MGDSDIESDPETLEEIRETLTAYDEGGAHRWSRTAPSDPEDYRTVREPCDVRDQRKAVERKAQVHRDGGNLIVTDCTRNSN